MSLRWKALIMAITRDGMTRCGATGKLIFPSKDAAQAALRNGLRSRKGNWHTKWCPFCSHYHNSSSSAGRKGKRDTEKVTRGKR